MRLLSANQWVCYVNCIEGVGDNYAISTQHTMIFIRSLSKNKIALQAELKENTSKPRKSAVDVASLCNMSIITSSVLPKRTKLFQLNTVDVKWPTKIP